MPNLLRWIFNFDHPWLDFNLRLSTTCIFQTWKIGLIVGSAYHFVSPSARLLSVRLCKGQHERLLNHIFDLYLIGIIGHRVVTTSYRLAPDEALPEFELSETISPPKKLVRPWLNRYVEFTAVTATWTLSLLLPNIVRVSLARVHRVLPIIGLNALMIVLYLDIDYPFAGWHHAEHKMASWFHQHVFSPERQNIQSERKVMSKSSLVSGQKLLKYKYAPLKSPECIRLLKITAHGGSVVYTLISVNIEDAPSYEALSYCWGSHLPDKEYGIAVDSTQTYIKITKNAHDSLQNLTPLDGVRYLWVDSICINQGNDVERSQQTQLMGNIFGNARSVIISLGGQRNDFELGYVLSKVFYFYMVSSKYDDLENLEFHSIYDQDFLGDKDFKLLHQLFQDEYWNRTWIIQEIALAKDISLLVGSVKISWSLLNVTLEMLRKEHGFRLAMFEKSEGYYESQIPIQRILSLGALRLIRKSDEPPTPLVHLVVVHNYTRATDLRDKVYAFLSLCRSSDREIIKPNYQEKDFVDVLSELVHLGLQTGSLLPLHIAGLTYDAYSLDTQPIPSWIPRLNQKLQQDITEFHDGTYMAGMNTAPEYRILSSRRVLKLKGCVVDSIVDKCADGDIYEFMNSHLRDRRQEFLLICMKRWVEMGELFNKYFDSTAANHGENLVKFWFTVMYRAQAETWEELCERTSWMRNFNEVMAPTDGKKHSPWQLTAKELHEQKLLDDVTGFEELVAITHPARTFAMTKTRLLPASVPRGTEICDIVVIMKGAPAPFILRPTGREEGGYLLIGEAYVDGIMYGEEMEGAELEWFDLC